MTDATYQRCLARRLEYVAKGEYRRACLMGDYLKSRGRRVPVIGRDDEPPGMDVIAKLYDWMVSGEDGSPESADAVMGLMGHVPGRVGEPSIN